MVIAMNKKTPDKDENYPGLYQKYKVYDADTDEPIDDFCFVLKPPSDPDAFLATWAYAKMIQNPSLTNDLMEILHEVLKNNKNLTKNLFDRVRRLQQAQPEPFMLVFKHHFDNEENRAIIDDIDIDAHSLVDTLSLIFKRWKVREILPVQEWGQDQRHRITDWISHYHSMGNDGDGKPYPPKILNEYVDFSGSTIRLKSTGAGL